MQIILVIVGIMLASLPAAGYGRPLSGSDVSGHFSVLRCLDKPESVTDTGLFQLSDGRGHAYGHGKNKHRYRDYEYSGDEWDSLSPQEQRRHLRIYRKRKMHEYVWPAALFSVGYALSMIFYSNTDNAFWDLVWYASGGWTLYISYELVNIQTNIGLINVEVNVGQDSFLRPQCQPAVALRRQF